MASTGSLRSHQPLTAPRGSPLTVLAPRVIPAAQASACVGIAFICTPIADTRPAVGEAPLATLTVVTAEAKGAGPAGTLPASPFAQGAEGPIRATLAGWG